MAHTPNFDDLKEECNSDRLEHCFRYFFMQLADENESFIALLEDECEVVQSRMQKQLELLQEGQGFNPFDHAVANGLQCMREAQVKDSRILAALNVVLVLAREARDEKRRHVSIMERYG